MSTIPTSITQEQFEIHILPHLRTAKRGYVSKIPLYKIFNYILYWLHTGCQWYQLPIEPDLKAPEKKEISYHAVYYHYRKWSQDGSLEKVWANSIQAIEDDLNLSELNLDGTHTLAKKGGQSVVYQGRKKAKTCNILPISDGNGFIIASTGIIAGNHNDAFNLKVHLQLAFKQIKQLGLAIAGAYFNAVIVPLIPKRLVKPASITLCGLICPRINVTAKELNEAENDYSKLMFTNDVLSRNAPLPGLINSNVYLSVLNARMLIFWLVIISLLL